MMDKETLHNKLVDYALGLLPEDEHEAVETLLATDAEARETVAAYRAGTDTMLLSVPLRTAPAGAKDALLKRLHDRESATDANATPTDRTRPFPLLAVLSAAALLLTIILATMLVFTGESPPPGLDTYNRVLAQEGAIRIDLTPHLDDAITGELVISPDGSRAAIRVNNLPALTEDEAFQLWLIDEDGAKSGGVLRFDTEAEAVYIDVPLGKAATDYDRIGMSLEPRDGSPLPEGPSGPRVFDVVPQPQDEA